jgi:hypothetical protein
VLYMKKDNETGFRGTDPQPDHGRDDKGHKDNGNGPMKPPSRPTVPAKSHAAVDYARIFTF